MPVIVTCAPSPSPLTLPLPTPTYHAHSDMFLCRKVVQNLVGEMEEEKKVEHGQPKVGNEDGYFSSYTHFKIHEEMLKVRM